MKEIKISKTLEGKIVKQIYSREINADINTNNSQELEIDAEGIIIEFTDGTKINCWNSEWGGIEIVKDKQKPKKKCTLCDGTGEVEI